ncbi:uncharacterized protein BO88DRAFT_486282 [Aspergillus vadensis CBS 113365]|uniref:Uncharacterized protein n=2 Tax=Aspergillus subgen. Circumdati TaxID=2720871 RepID=A0A319BLE1_ASPVC|nr:hypothetical protein BO88DRAFT_486282 [Aspergillus vadensis CBS 113365]PYH71830.1 hypothetical protein BO88DRAFT_486282 [Aspergillus vadensis CBS 113365]
MRFRQWGFRRCGFTLHERAQANARLVSTAHRLIGALLTDNPSLSEAPLCDGLLVSHLGSIVFGPCRSSAAGSYVIPLNPPSLLVHSAANPQVFKSHTSNPPTTKDSCLHFETNHLKTSTSHKMRVATLVLVAFSAVALALPTTNNVERAAADANVRQMDELTVAAISK